MEGEKMARWEQDGQETGEVPVVGKRQRSVERKEEANSWYPWSKG